MNLKHGKYSKSSIHNCIDCKKPIRNVFSLRCLSCATKGNKNGFFRHGKYCENTKNKCIDCDKRISPIAIRCGACAKLYLYDNPKNHPRFIEGQSFEEYGKEFDSNGRSSCRL